MNEQVQEIQIKLLEEDVKKYKREMELMRGKNEKYARVIKELVQIKNDIAELKQMLQGFCEIVEEEQNPILAPDQEQGRRSAYSITFRDLQKVSNSSEAKDSNYGLPKFSSYQKNEEVSKEKAMEEKKKNNRESFSFFKWILPTSGNEDR